MTRRADFLKEMGIGAVWRLRDKPLVEALSEATTESPAIDNLVQHPKVSAPATTTATTSTSLHVDEVPDLDMGFFDDVPPPDEFPPDFFESDNEPEITIPPRPDVSSMGWEQLEDLIRQCQVCGLCQGRTQAVPGVGDRRADWLFVGEGPGYTEDQQGEPFVGKSGQLLDNILLAIGLQRGNNAYIANVVKCRPTDSNDKDRPPTPAEAAACRPYLERQIALIQPKIIITLGRVASIALLGAEPQASMASLRGKAHAYRAPDGTEIPLVATYHPAYLLRQLSEKRKTWEDLCLAMKIQRQSIS